MGGALGRLHSYGCTGVVAGEILDGGPKLPAYTVCEQQQLSVAAVRICTLYQSMASAATVYM